MGFRFVIGNATVKRSKDDFPYLFTKWGVDEICLPEAPSFPNFVSSYTNGTNVSGGSWVSFCKRVGLHDYFFDKRDNLRAGQPGCIGITKEHADFVTSVLENYREQATLPPGYHRNYGDQEPVIYDEDLCVLIWLEWWMQWAVANCETPAIENC